MTIIAYKNGVLAADSGSWNEGRVEVTAFPKITRGVDGSLWAMSGKASNAWRLRQWVLAGADEKMAPEFRLDDGEPLSALVVRPEGTVFSIDTGWLVTPCTNTPGCWGEGNAAAFCEGAMFAGLSAADAVALTIEHHVWAHGPVQVERCGSRESMGMLEEVLF